MYQGLEQPRHNSCGNSRGNGVEIYVVASVLKVMMSNLAFLANQILFSNIILVHLAGVQLSTKGS